MALATDKPDNLPSTEGDKEPSDEAYVSFSARGVKLSDPPKKHDNVTLIVKGVCKGVHDDTMADGEDKITCVINVDSIFERGKVPIVDEGKPRGLFDFVSDQRLWETAKDTAFEKGEILDDVVTAFLRDYINSSDDDGITDAEVVEDNVDTKTDGGKVLRPEFSDDTTETTDDE